MNYEKEFANLQQQVGVADIKEIPLEETRYEIYHSRDYIRFCTFPHLLLASQEKKSGEHTDSTSMQSMEYYTCPMHPSVISDKPGACLSADDSCKENNAA